MRLAGWEMPVDFNLVDGPTPATTRSIPMSDPTSHDTSDTPSKLSAEQTPAPATVDAIPATPEQRQRLDRVRDNLLRVHRALLNVERDRYEKVKGRIPNNSAFLQLVINDPWFDWLRPMAQLVLLIDERLADKKQPLGAGEAVALFDRSRVLLQADSEGDAFQRLYYQAVQHSPDLAVLARQVATELASPSAAG